MKNIIYVYQFFISIISIVLLVKKRSLIWFDRELKKFFIFLFILWILYSMVLFFNFNLIYSILIFTIFTFSIFYFFNFYIANFAGHTYRLHLSYKKSAQHLILFRRLFLFIFCILYIVAVFLKGTIISHIIIFFLTNLLFTILVLYIQLDYFYIYQILLFLNITLYLSFILFLSVLLNYIFDKSTFFLLFMILFSFGLYPLYLKINEYIQYSYYRPNKDYNIILKNFLKKMLISLDVKELSDQTIKLIYEELEAKYVAIYLLNKRSDGYTLVSKLGNFIDNAQFSKEEFVNFIAKHREIIHPTFLKKNEFEDIFKENKLKIIVPLLFDHKLLGFIFLGEKHSKLDYIAGDKYFLENIGYYASITISNITRYDALKRSYWNSVRALANAIETKDTYTCGHSERVVFYSVIVAKEMGLDNKDIELLKFGGILHDVGKITIDDAIIKKNTGLTAIEREIIKSHPVEGENIILPITFLKGVRKIVRYHHERWDGTGYPDRLFKKEIPLLARIIQVVDTFDAITSSRAYRGEQNIDDAVSEIQRCSGTQFDPMIVYYFVRAVKKGLIRKINTSDIDFYD